MPEESHKGGWIIEPVARAISYVAEETNIAGTLHRSLMVLEANETILRLARETLASAGQAEAVRGIDELLKEAPGLSKSAAEVRADDFAIVNTHSLIAIWGAVEVAVEDTVALVLANDANALGSLADAGAKTSAFEPPPLSEEAARRLSSRLEKQLRNDLKVGEFYVKVLGVLGIDVSCSRHVLSKLQEANSVRNCLLHRGGVIDERAANSCGSLRPLLGEKVLINQQKYLEYYDAISEFLLAMSKGAISSPYVDRCSQNETNT